MSEYLLDKNMNRQSFYNLYLYAFNKKDSIGRQNFFFERVDHALNYGIKNGDEYVSGLYSLPFKIKFHGTNYNMNGIGDVMSAPEFSGKGGAGSLLKDALHDMYDNHIELSYLAPFSFDYYRKFGYEQTFNHMIYEINHEDIPFFKPANKVGNIKKGSFNSLLEELQQFYKQNDETLKGGVIREPWWWNYLGVKNSWDAAIYRDENNKIQGYIIYERDGMEFTVKERIYKTVDAFEALLSFVYKHGNSFNLIRYESNNSNYRGDILSNPYILNTKIEPFMMARIVDLKGFIEKYPFKQKQISMITNDITNIVFGINDPVIEDNNGNWSLIVSEGQTTWSKVTTPADIELNIQSLSQIMLGAISFEQSLKLGKISGDMKKAKIIDSIIQSEEPELIDYF